MFAPPPRIGSRVVARLTDRLRTPHPDRPGPDGQALDSFLEGPAFDRTGVLHLVDVPNGRILRLADGGRLETVAEYDGEPNGLKFHADGRLFVADYKNGLMVCDTESGCVEPLIERPFGERFKGLNGFRPVRQSLLHRSRRERLAGSDEAPVLPQHRRHASTAARQYSQPERRRD
jgi:gluconolactonase